MKRLFVFYLLIFTVLLSACDFGGDSAAKDGEKVINLSIATDPPALHPLLSTDTTSQILVQNAFEGLTRIDKDGEVTNALAEDIQESEDKKTYTYTIRDANWSNGDKVTAQDFEYAWKWALNPENGADSAYLLYYIEGAQDYNTGEGNEEDVGIKALDDKTLEVTLNNPTPYFNELVSNTIYTPLNHKYVEENPDWHKNIGTEEYVVNGPFEVSEFKSSDKIVLKKRDDYWDKDNVDLDVANINIIDSAATALKEFDSGNLDYLGSSYNTIDLNALDRFKEEDKLDVQDQVATYMLVFNTEEDIINNKNIRKALTIAIDREGLIENVTKGEETPATGLVPQTVKGFEGPTGYFESNDLDEAKKALDKGIEELGLNGPEDIKISLSYNTSEAHAAIMQYIQQGWQDNLGIDATLDNNEWQVYLQKLSEGDFQAGRLGWTGDVNDPEYFLNIYKNLGGNNQTRWHNEEYANLLDQSAAETDPDKRLELNKEAHKVFVNDYPIAPIYHYTQLSVKQDRVKEMPADMFGKAQLKYVKLEDE